MLHKILLFENITFNETINFLLENNVKEEEIVNRIENAMLKSRVLTFSNENSKLGEEIATFSLPAGWSCPFAKQCKMKVSREGTSRETGKDAEFMCYAAWQEIQYKALKENRWHNYDLLNEAKSINDKADLIYKSLLEHFKKGKKDFVRIHESGDFYSGEYLQAWIEVAKKMPDVTFYAYTKSLPILLKYKNLIEDAPNIKINLSRGSTKPELEGELKYPVANVFLTPEEVLQTGQLIDLDDSIARDKMNMNDFALLVHGMQTFELDTPNITKNRVRNEVFMKYYKYKNKLNELFRFDKNHKITNDEAKYYIKKILEMVAEKKIKKGNGDEIKKMLDNVIKFNNYNFDENLINTIPPKFR